MLHATEQGSGPRTVLLHGFTQTSVSWAPIAAELGRHRQVVTVDLPGHGGSGAVRLDLAGSAAAVAACGGRAIYVGYSMGARVALRIALDHPEVVERLVLIGGTAGIEDSPERAARRASDEALAKTIERDGVGQFLDDWMSQPLLAGLDPLEEDLAARRANTAAGLASSLRLCGTGTMDPPWWDELPALGSAGLGVTVVVGDHDAKFRALGQQLVSSIGPTSHLVLIENAGHACHQERPGVFVAAVFP